MDKFLYAILVAQLVEKYESHKHDSNNVIRTNTRTDKTIVPSALATQRAITSAIAMRMQAASSKLDLRRC